MSGFTSIPFKAEKHGGMSEINGIAKFSSAGIVLEFESKLFGLISNGVKESRLPMADILDVRFKKGIMKRLVKIEIRLKSLALLSELPASEGKVTLKIGRDDVDQARDAVAQLQKDMNAHRADLPPAHTPVSVLFDESEDETRRLIDG